MQTDERETSGLGFSLLLLAKAKQDRLNTSMLLVVNERITKGKREGSVTMHGDI